MKKLIVGMLVLVGLVGCSQKAVSEVQVQEHMQVREIAIDQEPVNNPYTYVVTEINGDEVNGIAIDNVTFENAGVVLSKDLDNIHNVQSGDVVQVSYGVAFDDIQNVTILDNDNLTQEQYQNLPKAVTDEFGRMMTLAEDGTYVTYYNK